MAISVLRMLDRLCEYDRNWTPVVCVVTSFDHCFLVLFLFWFDWFAIHIEAVISSKWSWRVLLLITFCIASFSKVLWFDCDVQNTFVETCSQFCVSVHLTNRQVVDLLCVCCLFLRDWYLSIFFEFWTNFPLSDIFSRPGISHPNGAMPKVLRESKLEEIEGNFGLQMVKHDFLEFFCYWNIIKSQKKKLRFEVSWFILFLWFF